MGIFGEKDGIDVDMPKRKDERYTVEECGDSIDVTELFKTKPLIGYRPTKTTMHLNSIE